MGNILSWFSEGFDIIRMVSSSLSDKPDAWEWMISRFEARDRVRPAPPNSIVFTGSSSITLWDTLAQDMAPLVVINRGFGGSRIDQVTFYAPRIVIPYKPRAVVLFAGTNDISGARPRTAQQVFEGYLSFVSTVHRALPEIPIYFVSITPTPSRWKLWPIVQEANRLISEHTKTNPLLRYIDLVPAILGPDGAPNRGLYRIDRLHPNRSGYQVWTGIIKPRLLSDLGA